MAPTVIQATPASIAATLLDHLRTGADLPSPGWMVGYIDTARSLRDAPGGRLLLGAVSILAHAWSFRLKGAEISPDSLEAAMRALRVVAGVPGEED